MNTLIIPILASNVNVGPSLHAVGLPSSNAITGFGHAALRVIKDMTGANPSDQGSALVINKYTLLPGRQKPQKASKGDMDKVKKGDLDASLSDERLSVIEGWVVVRFGIGLSGLTSIQDKLSEIWEQLHRLAFAGGVLSIPSKLILLEGDEDGSEAFKKLPKNSRIIVDHTHELQMYASAYGLDFFEAMIRLLVLSEDQGNNFNKSRTPEPAKTSGSEIPADCDDTPEIIPQTPTSELPMDQQSIEDREVFENSYLGHLVPIDIGYRALEEPQNREARGGYKHVFAEPVTGIARIQLLSSLMRKKESNNAFWHHHNQHPMYTSRGSFQHG